MTGMECALAAFGNLLSCGCNKISASLEEKYKYMKSSKEELQTLKDKRTDLIARVEDVNAKLLIAERVETWLNKADTVKSEVDVVQTKAEVPKRCLCGVLPNCCSRAKLGKQMVQLIGQMTNLLNDGQFTEEELALTSPKEEVQLLGDRKQELFAQVSDVNAKLLIAEGEGKTRTETVENWLNKSHRVISEVDVVLNSCRSGVLPNGCSRAELGKRMLELNKKMAYLLNTGKFTEEALAISVPETVREIPTTRLIGKTAEKNSETVWEWLMGDQFQNIGVYGMGGAGKTSLMKNINERLRLQQPRIFKSVLWVTVSKDVNAQKLQEQIARVVNNLDQETFAKQDEVGRSSMLLSALSRKGKFVLILDDIWKAFDLQELGVPKPSKDNGCKIVLTTRSLDVCRRMCQKEFKVGLLLEDEAWELFVKNVEEVGPEVEMIAQAIVAECGSLPLAIITVGKAMRRKTNVKEWQLALIDLQERSLNMAMGEEVIPILRFSYDQLKENDQKCFLYCALYPEDSEINPSELIEYWVLEGLVKGRSKEEEILRGDAILDSLKGCCMLEDGSAKGYVKMHDLIRDMALYVTESNPKFMVRAGYLSKEVPHKDDWSEDLERVSFMYSGIENIPIIPNCPKLLTLILAQKYPSALKHVEPDFFMHMKSLTVLDLSRTSIESLPDSLSDLVNLRGLLLIECEKLVRVPSLSKLQSLRVLKLTHSKIEELPHGMEMLVNLRSHDLSDNFKLKEMIPSGLISKFSLLEELQLYGIEAKYVYARERGRDFVRELSSLTHLENLRIKFHELSDFIYYGEFTNFEKLKKYFIKMQTYSHPISQHERSLCLSNIKGIPCNALRLPKSIQFLQVEHFNEISRLSELPLNDQTDLREVIIYFCNSMEFIVPEDEEGVFLQRIEKMEIAQCKSLSKIYEKVPAHGAFPCLKRLEISGCHNIKVLFSSRLLQQLLNLEEIRVWLCEQLEELVVADGDESGAIPVLPRLHNLKLYGLPKLKSNWSQLFMYSNSWQDVTIETVKLDRLFSTRLLQHFQYLEKIKVDNCEELEELIVEEEEACEIDYTVALPRLKELSLNNLPKMKSIWKGVMVCDSLETVTVRYCPELKRLPQLVCDSLERVMVSNCPELKRLPLFNREHQSAPPSLKEIHGSREWWDSLEWDYPRPEHLFYPLRSRNRHR